MEDGLPIHVTATVLNGIITGILGFFGMRLIKQVDMNTKEISDHRIEDAGKYATNTDVKESLNRVHDRIDTMSVDIKTLLSRHS